MKIFKCRCGQVLFFENTRCNACGRTLGFAADRMDMISLDLGDSDTWLATSGVEYRLCRNYTEFNVCNWLLPQQSNDVYCLACDLNEMIPSLEEPQNRSWWAHLEVMKRRLVYSLLKLELTLISRHKDPERGLAFAFLEDQRRNPNVEEEFVLTGHAEGLITVNLAEADYISREITRQNLGEAYRTLLGHFRHESGHYYFDRLIRDRGKLDEFRSLFGDESQDYQAALQRYYAGTRRYYYGSEYISSYASAHPIEDWAECWAHYLHMYDTLETAAEYDLLENSILDDDFDSRIAEWSRFTVALNALNRSMGLNDAYPFVLNDAVIKKLHYVHLQVSDPTKMPRQ